MPPYTTTSDIQASHHDERCQACRQALVAPSRAHHPSSGDSADPGRLLFDHDGHVEYHGKSQDGVSSDVPEIDDCWTNHPRFFIPHRTISSRVPRPTWIFTVSMKSRWKGDSCTIIVSSEFDELTTFMTLNPCIPFHSTAEASTDGGLRLGNIVPDFSCETTHGHWDSFHEWKKGKVRRRRMMRRMLPAQWPRFVIFEGLTFAIMRHFLFQTTHSGPFSFLTLPTLRPSVPRKLAAWR